MGPLKKKEKHKTKNKAKSKEKKSKKKKKPQRKKNTEGKYAHKTKTYPTKEWEKNSCFLHIIDRILADFDRIHFYEIKLFVSIQ